MPARLAKIAGKKLSKTARLIEKIGRAKTVKKGERLQAKAAKQVAKINTKAEKLALKKKNPLDPACPGLIAALLGPLGQAIDERRLGVTFPTGSGGGSCSGSQDMKATIGDITFTKGGNGSVRHENFGGFIAVSGCYIPSGGGSNCREVLYLSFPYLGGGATLPCGPFSSVLIEYDDFSGTYYSATSCTINVSGDPNGQLTGTWTATMTDHAFPVENVVEASGCFKSKFQSTQGFLRR